MIFNLQNIILTINSSLILILFLSTFFNQNTTTYCPLPNNSNRNSLFFTINNNTFFIILLKTMAIISLIPLLLSTFLNFPNIIISLNNWLPLNSFTINLEFQYDITFNIFFTIALFVSSSIIEFSHYYMNNDPNNNNFFRLLIIFLLNMIILTSTNNLFILFIGWEGVGFLSFLLIGWWFTRNNANSSAIQAIIYNRIGDIGLLFFFAFLIINFNSWSISNLSQLNLYDHPIFNLALIGALIAATGKSAQFGLHPWLPAAMEGPTPVSALLHSSTMVVAGIFLLIRISPLYNYHNNFNNWCLILGAITALFAATTAITQHDIKKIVAYSTTSQLGLMMVAIGLNQPNIALFHICTHAFFKAMLFLSSGSIIHSLNNEQDLRKMGGLFFILPNTSACILLGSLALSGIPFLAGFYSKDLILELSLTSLSNLFSLLLAFIATLLTATYSLRIIFFCFLSNTSFNTLSPTNEENLNLTNSLNRLALGTIIIGWTLSTFTFFIQPISITPLLKILALLITIFSLIYSIPFLNTLSQNTLNTLPLKLTFFSTSQWFYQNITHSSFSTLTFLTSLSLSTRNIDQGWNELTGAQGLSLINYNISQTYQHTQTGYIKHYLIMSFIILIILIISLSLLI
uniref:NADH dehydrogenase subunit 5 n=1 Tax=Zoroaster ophiactis TaxID=467010 RepID=UPI002027E60E|nr:NADH dehydrogenase subunit 5 [Zoroaster ophiactis]UPP55900.1 NADH dehydrogenase subunit 5 [Zoroaster ophiactis]